MAEKNAKMERGHSREYVVVILASFPRFRTKEKCLNSSSKRLQLTRKCLLLRPGINGAVFSESRARCHSIRFGTPKKASYRVCEFLIRSSPSGRQLNEATMANV